MGQCRQQWAYGMQAKSEVENAKHQHNSAGSADWKRSVGAPTKKPHCLPRCWISFQSLPPHVPSFVSAPPPWFPPGTPQRWHVSWVIKKGHRWVCRGGMGILWSRSKRPTGSVTDMLAPAPWNEDKTMATLDLCKIPANRGSGWSKKSYSFEVGCDTSCMSGGR